MENPKIFYRSNNKTHLNNFKFWAHENKDAPYVLYKIEYGTAEKLDFTPRVKFQSRSELMDYMFRAVKLNFYCEEVSTLVLSIYDPNVIELEELNLPAYYLENDKFTYEEKEVVCKFPTNRMLDAAYRYYRRISDAMATDILEEKVYNNDKVYTILTDINFYPSYYLDENKFYTYYFNKNNKGLSVCVFDKEKIDEFDDESRDLEIHMQRSIAGFFIGCRGKKLDLVRAKLGLKSIQVKS